MKIENERKQKEKKCINGKAAKRKEKNAYIGRKDLHNVHYYSLDSIALPSKARQMNSTKNNKQQKVDVGEVSGRNEYILYSFFC